MRPSFFVFGGILMLAASHAMASGQVLDGGPVSLNRAQTWCIAPNGPLPNWDRPGHPECKMVFRVLTENNGRTLYSARYAWPRMWPIAYHSARARLTMLRFSKPPPRRA